ncbi:MAG: hypothetical protein JWO67_20 [Streptosporangiaceae bacterium]|nr:hypothetical protein [Streptosporangiaceae bacterium]
MIPNNPTTALLVGVVLGLVVIPAGMRIVAKRRSAPVSR